MMPGFISERVIELPKSAPIPVPEQIDPPYDSDHGTLDITAAEEKPSQSQPAPGELFSLHESGTSDFFDPDRIGYVQDQGQVAGFISHRFTRMPEIGALNPPLQSSWKIARLELVSLLKHETPVAYVSKHLPQMDELQDALTRPLDEFERRSLENLRSDEDVMVEETPDRIRMIGSLRASRDCLKCHSVRRGELLGALTYEIVPVNANRIKPPQIRTPSS